MTFLGEKKPFLDFKVSKLKSTSKIYIFSFPEGL